MIKLQEALALGASLGVAGFSFAALHNSVSSGHGRHILAPSPVALNQLIPMADAFEPSVNGDSIVQALDYECPPCRGHEAENIRFRAEHPAVGWLVLQFPLGMHRHAYALSLSALEADRKGSFREFHTTVMAHVIRPQESVSQYLARIDPHLAHIAGQDLRKNGAFRKRLDTIHHLPIDGTPTYFVFRHDGATGVTNSILDAEAFLASAAPTNTPQPGCSSAVGCR